MKCANIKTQNQAKRAFESITRQWKGIDRVNDGIMILDDCAVGYIASRLMSNKPPLVEMRSLLNGDEYLSAEEQCELLQSDLYDDEVEVIILKDFNVIEVKGLIGGIGNEIRIRLEIKFLCDYGVEFLWWRAVENNLISQEFYSRLDKMTRNIKSSVIYEFNSFVL
jgi:hypothetical protein